MNVVVENIKKYYKILIICLVSIISFSGIYYYNNFHNKSDLNEEEKNIEVALLNDKEVKEEETDKIKVDVKGAVVTPGVYELSSTSTVDDAIKSAGGVLENGTTNNINLSRKLEDQMVIVIYTKKELESKNIVETEILKDCIVETPDITPCIEEAIPIVIPTDVQTNTDVVEEIINNDDQEASDETIEEKIEKNTLVSINKAEKEELMLLEGIGDAKAEAIITYRKTKAFSTLEELMDVDGIGQNVFDKIKDSITL